MLTEWAISSTKGKSSEQFALLPDFKHKNEITHIMPAELDTSYIFTGQSLVGQTFGSITVLSYARRGGIGKASIAFWNGICVCGKHTLNRGGDLREGKCKSCGCMKGTMISRSKQVHGHANRGQHSPIYEKWAGSIARCYNPKKERYPKYGGRRIKVCNRWRNSFEAFLEDMEPTFVKGLTLDRINVNGNYSCGKCPEYIEHGWPMNCRWATAITQQNNTQDNHRLTLNGENHTIAEWARLLNKNVKTLYARAYQGWSDEYILTT